jgi:hypothetical protein
MATIAPFPGTSSLTQDKKLNVDELQRENVALKSQVKTLQAELETVRKENTELKKKRKAPPTASSESQQPASKKAKTPVQRNKLFEKWVKAAVKQSAKEKINTCYYSESYTAEVKETTPWTQVDFDHLFAGQGTKIQPTPENKPTSQITVLRFADFAAIQKLFGDAQIQPGGYKVQVWRKRNFQKSYHNYDADAELEHLEVHYNKSKQTLILQFKLKTVGPDEEDGWAR